jgi:hypothetical protein
MEQYYSTAAKINKSDIENIKGRLERIERCRRPEGEGLLSTTAVDRLATEIAEASDRTEAMERRHNEDPESLKAYLSSLEKQRL